MMKVQLMYNEYSKVRICSIKVLRKNLVFMMKMMLQMNNLPIIQCKKKGKKRKIENVMTVMKPYNTILCSILLAM